MKVQSHESEKGQAIVYLVIGLVVFLGFVALAIDGGMALADRRHSQNAADAASLAGAGDAGKYMETHHVTIFNFDCVNNGNIQAAINQAENTAIQRAHDNEFTIQHGISQKNGTDAACGSTGYPGGIVDRYLNVTVEISATTQSNFLQLIFPTALHNEVDSVARVRPRRPPAFGSAIVALNTALCGGAGTPGGVFYGGMNINIEGGGIFSNGCLNGNGSPTITVTGGGKIIGNQVEYGNANWSPLPVPTDVQVDSSEFNFDAPNCTGKWVSSLPNSAPPNPPLDGLYCMNGNLTIQGNEVITGSNVTIYIPNGKLDIRGNATINLSAPPAGAPYPPAIPGVLFYVPNGGDVVLNGTEDSWFKGMILAPKSNVQINGTGGNTYQGQVIGWNVNVGGSAETFILYNPEGGYTLPTSIELAK